MTSFRVSISPEELTEFEDAVLYACHLRSHDPIRQCETSPRVGVPLPHHFRDRRGSLVVTFDGWWNPFLCDTTGYNNAVQRWYVPSDTQLLKRIANAFAFSRISESPRIPGGRVFLHSEAVDRKTPTNEIIQILKWALPRQSTVLHPPAQPVMVANLWPA